MSQDQKGNLVTPSFSFLKGLKAWDSPVFIGLQRDEDLLRLWTPQAIADAESDGYEISEAEAISILYENETMVISATVRMATPGIDETPNGMLFPPENVSLPPGAFGGAYPVFGSIADVDLDGADMKSDQILPPISEEDIANPTKSTFPVDEGSTGIMEVPKQDFDLFTFSRTWSKHELNQYSLLGPPLEPWTAAAVYAISVEGAIKIDRNPANNKFYIYMGCTVACSYGYYEYDINSSPSFHFAQQGGDADSGLSAYPSGVRDSPFKLDSFGSMTYVSPFGNPYSVPIFRQWSGPAPPPVGLLTQASISLSTANPRGVGSDKW